MAAQNRGPTSHPPWQPGVVMWLSSGQHRGTCKAQTLVSTKPSGSPLGGVWGAGPRPVCARWPEDEASAHVSGSNGSPLTQWNSSPTLRRPIQGSLRVNLNINSCTKERGKAQSAAVSWRLTLPKTNLSLKTDCQHVQMPRGRCLSVPQK